MYSIGIDPRPLETIKTKETPVKRLSNYYRQLFSNLNNVGSRVIISIIVEGLRTSKTTDFVLWSQLYLIIMKLC